MRRRTPDERPLSAVPRAVKGVLIAALAAHLAWQAAMDKPAASAAQLGMPFSPAALRLASLGDGIVLAQALILYLQAFDHQPGVSIPFARLDYDAVERWLEAALALDPRTHYPLVLAAHLYARVPDPAKERRMLAFIHRQFLHDPDRRWRWLAHAALVARHRLRDVPLALRFAEDIARHAPGAQGWARQMRIFILADMGETESAAVLLGALLVSGEVDDPAEVRFLTQRLEELKNAEKSTPSSRNR